MPAMIAHPGMPVWQTLVSRDLEAAKAFYADVFGWEFKQVDDTYAVATKDGMPVAGLTGNPDSPGSRWGLYFYAQDVAGAHEAALKVGGQGLLGPTPTDDGTTRALLTDPTGALVSLKDSADEQAIMAAGEPGTPVWFELTTTRNWEDTLEFYHQLTGLDIKIHGGEPGGRYATGDLDGHGVIGFWESDATAGSPAQSQPVDSDGLWLLTWGVKDLKAALEAVKQRGGHVAQVSSGGDAPAALILDAEGAAFQLAEVPEYDPAADDVHEPDVFA